MYVAVSSMTKDRLMEFHVKSRKAANQDWSNQNGFTNEISFSVNKLDQFLSQVTDIKIKMADLKSDVEKIKMLFENNLTSDLLDAKTIEEMCNIRSQIKSNSQSIRIQLKDMKATNGYFEKLRNDLSTYAQIRSTQYSVLMRQYVNIMYQYRHEEENYSNKCKVIVPSKCKIDDDQQHDDFEEVTENINLRDFLQEAVLDTELARQTLIDITTRYNDFVGLETSLAELKDLFSEMDFLVETQGVEIDEIKTQVMSAEKDTKRAVLHLQAYASLKRTAKRRKRFAACIFILLCVLLALIIFLSLVIK